MESMSKGTKGVQPALNHASQAHPPQAGYQGYYTYNSGGTSTFGSAASPLSDTNHSTYTDHSRNWTQWQQHPTYHSAVPSWDQFAPYSSHSYASVPHTPSCGAPTSHPPAQPETQGYDEAWYTPAPQWYEHSAAVRTPSVNDSIRWEAASTYARIPTQVATAEQKPSPVSENGSKKRQKVPEGEKPHQKKKRRLEGKEGQTSMASAKNAPQLHRIDSVDMPISFAGTQVNPIVLDLSSPPKPAAKRAVMVHKSVASALPQRLDEPTMGKIRHLGQPDSSVAIYPSQPSSTAKPSKKKPTAATAVHNHSLSAVNGTVSVPAHTPPTQIPPVPMTTTTSHTYSVPTPADEPPLCKEQADLVDLIMSGRNVFYTGSAGCGKSTVLKAFVKKFKERGKTVNILAPTGRAALAVNGTTTWQYMGWVPGHHKKMLDELLKLAHGKHVYKRLNETDVLVIDEISMVENLHFERMHRFMQAARGNGRAFGGVQLVVTGDFCQLPPVKPFQHCMHCGKELKKKNSNEYHCDEHGVYHDRDKWAFRSAAWKECNFVHVNLTNIHRQSDRIFINLLQKLRIGRPLTTADVNLLLNHPTKGVNANAVKLFGSRAEVNRLNYERFSKLQSRARTYKCVDEFIWNEEHRNLERMGRVNQDGALIDLEEKEHRYSSQVHLKKGMAVVLLANLDITAGLVNGAQGTIQGFVPYDEKLMPKASSSDDKKMISEFGFRPALTLAGAYSEYREAQIQKFINMAECKEWPEVRFNNGQRRVIYADCTVNEYGDSKPYTLLTRTQIPLMAGYAITTHKSQGMTLDKVEVDLSRTFEAGQAYVALSRARSLEGLKVVSFPQQAQCGADPQVQEFLREKFPEAFSELEDA